MSGLAFLKNVSLQSNAAVKTPIARAKSNTARTPENADIRVFRNGSVYPSAQLVTKCNLQYVGKDVKEKGNGFDVFSSKNFLNTRHLTQAFIFIALVPKDAGKVDLFAATTYGEAGEAKSDVLTQGAVTFGLELLKMVKETYGIELAEGQSFIDLKIISESPFNTDDNIYWVPKVISRGEKKGETDLVRREELTLYPLVPVSLMEEDVNTAPASEVNTGSGELNAATFVLDGEPTLAELEAGNSEIPEEAAELPAGILNSEDDDDDTLSV